MADPKTLPLSDTTVIVTGMHRSGTSLLAGLLGKLGLRQANLLMPPNQANPAGYFEPPDIAALNDEILGRVDRSWADPKPMPDGWMASGALTGIAERARDLFGRRFDSPRGAVVKDPRFSRTLPVWLKLMAEIGTTPVIFIASRHPAEVGASLCRRDGMSSDHAERLWASYFLEAEHGSRGCRRCVVRYEEMLSDAPQALVSAFADMGVDLGPVDAATTAELRDFVDGALHRNRLAQAEDQGPAGPDDLATRLFAHAGGDRRLVDHEKLARFHRDWQADWTRISPGAQRSDFMTRFPGWYVSRSQDLLQSGGDVDEAMALLHRAAELAPAHFRPHHLMGNVHAHLGELPAAVAAQRRAIAFNAGFMPAHMALIRGLRQMGTVEEAIRAARHALKLEPGHTNARHLLGVLLAEAGDMDAAIDAQREVIARNDSIVAAHLALCRALLQTNDVDGALRSATRAVEIAPDTLGAQHLLGSVLARRGEWEGAIAAQQRALALDGAFVPALVALSRALSSAGRTDEAIQAAQRANEVAPNHAVAKTLLKRLLAEGEG
ncbi:tetratricopeptide repeat protein [Roseisalinus antarcticus]|uniref:Tetratricopeptide repeat protein n=1 Tax=Roseisalinus antarcticus TaxID=254357 RepID=A0A1Y5TZM9_9RHOB|nr:tetratricopeptide repeat protein [Roseisalinus antarcticus]SLN76854.1 tetratricopeptide repeat protein [Roseisalinus antarcticus]